MFGLVGTTMLQTLGMDNLWICTLTVCSNMACDPVVLFISDESPAQQQSTLPEGSSQRFLGRNCSQRWQWLREGSVEEGGWATGCFQEDSVSHQPPQEAEVRKSTRPHLIAKSDWSTDAQCQLFYPSPSPGVRASLGNLLGWKRSLHFEWKQSVFGRPESYG